MARSNKRPASAQRKSPTLPGMDEQTAAPNAAPTTAPLRYIAFISYRHQPLDKRWAAWLHRTIETYSPPLPAQSVGKRKFKVFRDQEELTAGALTPAIEDALRNSEWLIVICSTNTPASHWVNREIAFFEGLGRRDRVLALQVDGEPQTSMPPILAARLGSNDELLAADLRGDAETSDREAKRLAFLRLMARMLGVGFDDLRQRDQERRNRTLRLIAAASLVGVALFAALALWSEVNRREAEAQYLASQRNLAASFAEQGDRAWLERDIAGAEVAYARAIVTDDQRTWREKLIEVRARGIRRLWAAPNRLRADVVAYGARAGELLVALRDRTIRTWDLEAKTNTEVWQGHKAPITALVGNKEGHIASGDANGDVWLWTRGIAQGSMLSPSHFGSVLDLAFLSDGAIASIGSDGILIIRDAADGTATLNVRLAGAPPDAAVILPDIGVVIVGDRKGRLRTHRLSDGEESSAFAAGSTAIGALAVNSDRTRVATWSAPAGNGQIAGITVWQRETEQLIARGPDDLGNPSTHGLSFSPDGEELAMSQGSGGLLWRIGDPPKQHSLLPANDTMRCFLYLDNGNRLAAGGDALHLWALHPTNKEVDLPGHAKSPSAAAFSPDGKVIATTGFDGSLRLWDAAQAPRALFFAVKTF